MPPHLDTQNIIRLFSYVHLTKSHKHRSAKEHRGSLLVLESPRGDSGLSSVKSPCDTCCPQHHLAHTVSPETLLSSLEQLKAAFSGTPGRIRLRVEKVHTQNVLSGIRYVPPAPCVPAHFRCHPVSWIQKVISSGVGEMVTRRLALPCEDLSLSHLHSHLKAK